MVTTRSSRAAETARPSFHYGPRQPATVEGSWGSKYIDHYLENDCLMNGEELKRLTLHKYSAVDTSYLDELCMKKFWDRLVQYYPMWLAPNLITLIGLIVNLITVLTLTYYCPTATESAPRWVYILAAIGLFVYQTLDATDGKQARRTGSASPLGELFDHGCDSLSQVFVTLNVCCALQLGQVKGAVFFVCVVSISLFYCAHWGTYCSGVLKFARFDVTEAQVAVIIVLLVTGIVGPNLWSLGLFGYQLRHLVVIGTLLGAIYQAVNYLSVVYTGGVGKNGSTVAGTSVLFPACPLLAVVVPFCMMYTKADSLFFDENIAIFVILFGAIASKATNRLIVAHMSRSELFLWDWIYLAPIGLMLNQYYDYFFSEYKLLILASIYAWASLLIYCTMAEAATSSRYEKCVTYLTVTEGYSIDDVAMEEEVIANDNDFEEDYPENGVEFGEENNVENGMQLKDTVDYMDDDGVDITEEESPSKIRSMEEKGVVNDMQYTADEDDGPPLLKAEEDFVPDYVAHEEEVIAYEEDNAPVKWTQPTLEFNTMIALGLFNTDRKEMTKSEIFAFLAQHFPYYDEMHTAADWHKLQCKLFQRGFNERGEEVFQMKERHIVAIMRKLKDTWKSVSDLTSRYYSLRDPTLWPLMVDGRYRQYPGEPGPRVSENEPNRNVYMRPAFTEKILLAIAMIQFQNRGVTFLELCSFIEYYFPHLRTCKTWKNIAFTRLKTPPEKQGMFARCREGHNILFAIAYNKWNDVDKTIQTFKSGRDTPGANSGLIDENLWEDLLWARLDPNAVPESIIEKVRKEIKPIEEQAKRDKIFDDLPDTAILLKNNANFPLISPNRNAGAKLIKYDFVGPVIQAPGRKPRKMVYNVYRSNQTEEET